MSLKGDPDFSTFPSFYSPLKVKLAPRRSSIYDIEELYGQNEEVCIGGAGREFFPDPLSIILKDIVVAH